MTDLVLDRRLLAGLGLTAAVLALNAGAALERGGRQADAARRLAECHEAVALAQTLRADPAAPPETLARLRQLAGTDLPADCRPALAGLAAAESARLPGLVAERDAAAAEARFGTCAALGVTLLAVATLGGLGRCAARDRIRAAVGRQRAADERFRAFMDNGPAVAFMKDELGRYVYANEPLARRFGVPVEGWIGRTDRDIFPDRADKLREQDRLVLAQGAGARIVESIAAGARGEGGGAGGTHWQTYKFPVQGPCGARYVAGIAIDVTEQHLAQERLAEYRAGLETANAELRRLAATDWLTGARNRAAFDERLAHEAGLAARTGAPLSVVLLDVDHFKQFNDEFGHPAGDDALREVARILASCARETDLVARYGGEEFALVLPGADAAGALALAERCRAAVQGAPWAGRPVTLSAGAATLAPGEPTAELVRRADAALYRAKQSGRNRCCGA